MANVDLIKSMLVITVKQITQVSVWTVLYIGIIEKSYLRKSAQSFNINSNELCLNYM